ncbi:E3 ubiquitin-protein ligase CHFR-like [Babylonia areolata]|uniref:E3 ubiquitin-protein ligase CHFR-like n=1 Tax=Babylonia areolata TaxID=304850 RepID=UPI003FD2A558
MSVEGSTADWAQLVCVTDTDTPPYLIAKDKFTIGRARGCDISHENNKLVSGSHCYILRDESGKVWLYDTSTNGTLLNSKTKLSKGECRELEHGDEFFVVHKKDDEDVNIGYVFQDLARLKEEEEQDDSGELENTLEYESAPHVDATLLDDSINQVDGGERRSAVKRKQTPQAGVDAGPSNKRLKAGQPEAVSSSEVSPASAADATPTADTATATADTATARNDSSGCQAATELTKAEGKQAQKEGGGKEEGREEEEARTATKSTLGGGEGGGEGKGEKQDDDAFAETLTCIICQELLYDCVSLQPCMHSFCAGCYSEWMAHSPECPSCRGKVDRINKNHIVNNLVEAYLKEHPEKRRPEEDTKELDAKNKITRDQLYPKRKRTSSSEYENSDDNSSHCSDETDTPPPTVFPTMPFPAGGAGTVFGFGTPLFGASNAFRSVCRQCPGQTNQGPGVIGTALSAIKGFFAGPQTTTATTATPSTSGNNNDTNNNDTNNNDTDQPSTSGAGPSGDGDYMERDKKTMPEAPPYTCVVNQNHVLCQCCLQIFPDRRATFNAQPDTTPPQQCTICYRAYCHAYWGCRKADCNGCLARFEDMNFGRKVLPGLILGNQYESEIFVNYLQAKKLAVRDVLAACIAKLEQGQYSCPDQARYNMTGKTPVCFACGLRNFKALVYQYRAEIPRDQLPANVTARADCYWGKNCRTQYNKPAHAMRFNHICEQTRT